MCLPTAASVGSVLFMYIKRREIESKKKDGRGQFVDGCFEDPLGTDAITAATGERTT